MLAGVLFVVKLQSAQMTKKYWLTGGFFSLSIALNEKGGIIKAWKE
jgi:hypothetical protein